MFDQSSKFKAKMARLPVVYTYRNKYVYVLDYDDLPSSFILPFTSEDYKDVCSRTNKELYKLRKAIFILFDFLRAYKKRSPLDSFLTSFICKDELRYLLIDVSTTATELTHLKLGHCKFEREKMLEYVNTARLAQRRFELIVDKLYSLP